MVEEQGHIIRVDVEGAIVAVVQTRACQSCKARQGCGQAVLSEWGSTERQDARNHFFIDSTSIDTDLALQPGDRVILGIADDALSRSAIWMYLWPLLPAFLVLWSGTVLSVSEPVQLIGALVAGALAVLVTRWRFARPDETARPRILAVDTPPARLIARQAG